MKLYIAEKPSLGRAIADALPKPHKKMDGHIIVGNGDIVSWCIGHLLELAEPDEYHERYKKWNLADLPIAPDTWQLKAKAKTRKQLTLLKKLIKQASQLVHAGDPDREGQLLVDEVISEANVSKTKLDTTERLLISDLNLNAVKKALANLKSNRDFIPLSVSALARSRADWLIGMNLTRAYTIKGKQGGYTGVLSVGRVQTPILGLVVRRDLEIENFVSRPFYEVMAENITEQGEQFQAKWLPSEACVPYQDEDGRVLHKGLCENVISRITGQQGQVLSVEEKTKKQAPPLPYNLSALQIDAAKLFKMPAKKVLDICQSLYEKHKLITYPRSDNRYLPKEHFFEAAQVLSAMENNKGQSTELIANADTSIKHKCWNDKKVEAHHAIIPTAKKLKSASLGFEEEKIYGLICRQYLALFYPDFIYHDTTVLVEIAGGKFKATAKRESQLGFKVLMGKSELKDEVTLPALSKGQSFTCQQGRLVEKKTEPPQHFNDASLLSAMTGIARYVDDAEIKKILRDTDGLGTEATRAGIIELLFKRGFLQRQGKHILATETGKALINVLPEKLTKPDMTALWESQLTQIAEKHGSYISFMSPLLNELQGHIELASKTPVTGFSNLPPPKQKPFKRRYKRKKPA
ncbi:DNA topoisomerase 3 [Pseudoalteromonas sp. P1-9]|uniref:DNA topoisomerase III n=1 Tax=Pseudoalteromonas sp. P1-9 TaxID=1710354 RepID=UPI0006D60A06|nr:DNA topoisomerase III [Pseudoalteromonas sp. P1-9]KPV95444.1 DNA topoisomerase 3 [Pseudoalteromonas sp. P1-9]